MVMMSPAFRRLAPYRLRSRLTVRSALPPRVSAPSETGADSVTFQTPSMTAASPGAFGIAGRSPVVPQLLR